MGWFRVHGLGFRIPRVDMKGPVMTLNTLYFGAMVFQYTNFVYSFNIRHINPCLGLLIGCHLGWRLLVFQEYVAFTLHSCVNFVIGCLLLGGSWRLGK